MSARMPGDLLPALTGRSAPSHRPARGDRNVAAETLLESVGMAHRSGRWRVGFVRVEPSLLLVD